MTHAALKDQKANAELALAKTAGGHLSHEEIASKVRMLMRMDLDHEAVCTMARDRIRWLAGRVAELEAAPAALSAMEGEAVAWEVAITGLSGNVYRFAYVERPNPEAFGPNTTLRPLIYGDTAPPPQQAGKDFEFGGYCGTCGSPCDDQGRSIHGHASTHPTPPPGPQGGGEALATDEVLVAITRGEGYEDVAPELVAEDALGPKNPFKWRVVATPPAPQPQQAGGDAVVVAVPVPPANCRQRLSHEGKPYPRSSCEVCGKFSPNWRQCDAVLHGLAAAAPQAGKGDGNG